MSEKWDLTHLFKTEEEFLAELEWFKKDATEGIKSFEGKLGNDNDLCKYFDLNREIEERVSKLYMFASMRSDLDKKNVPNAQDLAKVQMAFNDFSAAAAYTNPEYLALGEKRFNDFFASHPEYKDFDFQTKKLFKESEHVLPGNLEKLASNYSPLLDAGRTLYSQLSVGDYTPNEITLSTGEKVTVTMSNWTNLIEKCAKAEDRALVFETLYSYYDQRKSTYGEIYNIVLQTQLSEVKARGYKSILDLHLNGNNIPTDVFHSLIDVASTQTDALKKYYELRRKYLGLEKHRSYDRFLKLAKSEKTYTYEEAKNLFYDSLKNFPEDFQKKAHEVTKDGYVDVYPGSGKRTGAYSNGGDNVHPYILLNFDGNLEDVFTLAHESGHSSHTLYSMESQPVMKQGYTIFVAEIASTFNEHNLLDYLMNSGTLSRNDKIALLQKAIDQICSTFYRQTLFAHYEYDISLLAEKGEPINYQVLSDEMTKLYKQYYGIDISEEKVKPLVWAYIPHLFYTPFYVYQYATSFTASMLIYDKVRKGEPNAFENYLKVLKSGGSDYPIEEVKLAGVDLSKREPFEAVTRRMSELVDELEKLLAE